MDTLTAVREALLAWERPACGGPFPKQKLERGNCTPTTWNPCNSTLPVAPPPPPPGLVLGWSR